ncbi:MAG: histidine--tRNA ligase [bacterium]|nr:histidine--tRNA ligase [bacterium]
MSIQQSIKPLRGFRDYMPEDLLAREKIISCIKKVYESYGFAPMATPGLEYKETLLSSGGEEINKQIYSFIDKEGNEVGLRFDLTVPLSRVVAQYTDLPMPFKRYQIQPVWRFDKPDPGRFREFIQFDIDTVGANEMIADVEIILAMYDSLIALSLTNFRIRFSSRKILNSLITCAGIPLDKSLSIFKVIDKLEKQGLEAVKQELGSGRIDSSGAEIKGLNLDELQIKRIMDFLLLPQGTRDEAIASATEFFKGVPKSEEGLRELKEISEYLDAFEIPKEKVVIDLSIARGLDYYTGPVYEAILLEAREFGVVLAGGRYDQLIKRPTGEKLPATGASIGIDRLFAALKKCTQVESKSSVADVLVTVMLKEKMVEYLKISHRLRKEGINTELYIGTEKRIGKQLEYADRHSIPIAVIIGSDEFSNNQITIKDLRLIKKEKIETVEHGDYLKARIGQKTVQSENLIEEIKQFLQESR